MSRRKSLAADPPANLDEALIMIHEYCELERARLLEELAADEAIARVKEQRADLLAEIDAEARPLFMALQAWWEAGGAAYIAKGKRSAELGGAKIGIRKTPPAVKLARKVKLGDVVAWLQGLRWGRAKEFLRVKVTLDREAVIKAVRADAKVAETFASRLSVEQVDEFFIDAGIDAQSVKKEVAAV
jgi:phage host-nuclease inhibitor protein Gam